MWVGIRTHSFSEMSEDRDRCDQTLECDNVQLLITWFGSPLCVEDDTDES